MGRDGDCEGKKWVYTEISHGQRQGLGGEEVGVH